MEPWILLFQENLYQKILKETVRLFTEAQARNDQNTQANPPSNDYKKLKKIKVLEWPSQNLDFNQSETLWRDLEKSIMLKNSSMLLN